jgi:hypothetical protein
MIIAMAYAEKTSVPADRSRSEIERTLERYGASAFSYGWEAGRAVVMFRASDRHVKFEVSMPTLEQYRYTETGRTRTDKQTEEARDQAVRQRWRALALVVKAKLEAVETGITSFEEEFLAHIVLPSGETFGQWAQPQIAEAYEHGVMPGIVPGSLPALTAGEVVE